MCQMCDEYEAELRRLGVPIDPADREKRHTTPEAPPAPRPQPVPADRKA